MTTGRGEAGGGAMGAVKGEPDDSREAGRLDGVGEAAAVFFRQASAGAEIIGE